MSNNVHKGFYKEKKNNHRVCFQLNLEQFRVFEIKLEIFVYCML